MQFAAKGVFLAQKTSFGEVLGNSGKILHFVQDRFGPEIASDAISGPNLIRNRKIKLSRSAQ